MSPRHFSGNRYSPAFRTELKSGHKEIEAARDAKIEDFLRKFKFWTYFKKKSN